MTGVADLSHALSSWAPGDAPCADWLLPELRTLLRATFSGAYRPAAVDTGWSLDFMHGAGPGAKAYVKVFRDYVAQLPTSEDFLVLGNPHLVQPDQRNKVMLMPELIRRRPEERGEMFVSLFRALGILGHDQIRVQICDGPRQLAWIGATREEPFTGREVRLLRRLRGPLRERFRLERQLARPEILAGALEAALEALAAPAFVVGPSYRIEVANRAGLTWLARDRRATIESIRRSARGGAQAGAFAITRLGRVGDPAYLLAIGRESNGLAERVALAQERWGLSVRQARVLELVATGASNKDIATALACAEVTVENHVTELFRRSGARSRAGLVGRLIG